MLAVERSCPDCAETIKAAAKVCRHCGFRIAAAPDAEAASLPVVPPPAVEIFHCLSCGKGTLEKADRCRHCNAPIGIAPPVATWDKPPPGSLPPFFERTFDDPRGAKIGCIAFIVAIVVGVSLLLSYCSSQRAEEQVRADAEKKIADEDAAKKAAENRRKGFHCLSGWNGSHPDVVDTVKRGLRDPESFDHIETIITPANAKGQHQLMMTYRAKNGFGGMMPGRAIATVSATSCRASVTATE